MAKTQSFSKGILLDNSLIEDDATKKFSKSLNGSRMRSTSSN